MQVVEEKLEGDLQELRRWGLYNELNWLCQQKSI